MYLFGKSLKIIRMMRWKLPPFHSLRFGCSIRKYKICRKIIYSRLGTRNRRSTFDGFFKLSLIQVALQVACFATGLATFLHQELTCSYTHHSITPNWMIQKLLSFSLFLLLSSGAFAQNASLVGSVKDADNNVALTDASVVLSGTGKLTATIAGGEYRIENVPAGTYTLVVSSNGYLPQDLRVVVPASGEIRTDVLLRKDQNSTSTPTVTEIPTITLEEAEAESEGSGEVANLLNASRDVYQQISGFGWGTFRFRERGYDSEHFPLFLCSFTIFEGK